MSFSANYPTSRPALNLNFARSKVLDPRITFTRASTATYYDGVTTAKAEENLLLRSQEFDTSAVWGSAAGGNLSAITANAAVAPDGTTTAEELIENSSSSFHRIGQSSASASATTFSVFAKASVGTRYLVISISNSTTNYASATFDLSTGASTQTLTNGTYGAVTTSSVSVGNSWYRCIMTVTVDTATSVAIGLSNASTFVNSNRGFPSYTGDGASSIYAWGAQLEQRSSVTSYTATTTQAITNYIPVLLSATNNVSRFDHNPTTGESLGLLIEEQRTNLFPYSEDFADTAWLKGNSSITSNIIVAPDGTLTGDKLVENTATNTHFVSDNVNLIANTSYTATVYVKAAERTRVRLQNSSIANWTTVGDAYFDLSAGTIVSGTGSITAISNGWYRCSINGTFGGANAAGGLNIFIVESGTTTSYTGDGYSGLYLWGAQLEAGAFPTSYIATVAATATRIADTATMTGTNFSSWYNQSEGTTLSSFDVIGYNSAAASSFPRIFSIDDGTSSNRMLIASTNTGGSLYPYGFIARSATTQAEFYITAALFTSNVKRTAALAYKVNDSNFVAETIAGTTDTSCLIPVVNQITFGSALGGTFLNGHIRRLAYYPLRLTNAQLQALTS